MNFYEKWLKNYKDKSQKVIKQDILEIADWIVASGESDHFVFYAPVILSFATGEVEGETLELANEINDDFGLGFDVVDIDDGREKIRKVINENMPEFKEYVEDCKAGNRNKVSKDIYEKIVQYMVACLSYKKSVTEDELDFLERIGDEELVDMGLSYGTVSVNDEEEVEDDDCDDDDELATVIDDDEEEEEEVEEDIKEEEEEEEPISAPQVEEEVVDTNGPLIKKGKDTYFKFKDCVIPVIYVSNADSFSYKNFSDFITLSKSGREEGKLSFAFYNENGGKKFAVRDIQDHRGLFSNIVDKANTFSKLLKWVQIRRYNSFDNSTFFFDLTNREINELNEIAHYFVTFDEPLEIDHDHEDCAFYRNYVTANDVCFKFYLFDYDCRNLSLGSMSAKIIQESGKNQLLYAHVFNEGRQYKCLLTVVELLETL